MDLFFVRKEVNVMPKPVRYTFKDRATGAPVATAIIPEGYLVNATITDKYSNDLVPLQAYTLSGSSAVPVGLCSPVFRFEEDHARCHGYPSRKLCG